MRRTSLVIAVLAAALAFTATAGAEIATFGEARKAHLHVISSIILTGKAVDMRGGWFNTSVSCLASRKLRVHVQIQRTRGTAGSGLATTKAGQVMNCAEGGPSFGFSFDAADAGMACASGAWKPGRYDFLTRTRHVRSGVVALATLSWTKRAAC